VLLHDLIKVKFLGQRKFSLRDCRVFKLTERTLIVYDIKEIPKHFVHVFNLYFFMYCTVLASQNIKSKIIFYKEPCALQRIKKLYKICTW
jgi:hypothetical protein